MALNSKFAELELKFAKTKAEQKLADALSNNELIRDWVELLLQTQKISEDDVPSYINAILGRKEDAHAIAGFKRSCNYCSSDDAMSSPISTSVAPQKRVCQTSDHITTSSSQLLGTATSSDPPRRQQSHVSSADDSLDLLNAGKSLSPLKTVSNTAIGGSINNSKHSSVQTDIHLYSSVAQQPILATETVASKHVASSSSCTSSVSTQISQSAPDRVSSSITKSSSKNHVNAISGIPESDASLSISNINSTNIQNGLQISTMTADKEELVTPSSKSNEVCSPTCYFSSFPVQVAHRPTNFIVTDSKGITHLSVVSAKSYIKRCCIGCGNRGGDGDSNKNRNKSTTSTFCLQCQWALCDNCFPHHTDSSSFTHIGHRCKAYVKHYLILDSDVVSSDTGVSSSSSGSDSDSDDGSDSSSSTNSSRENNRDRMKNTTVSVRKPPSASKEHQCTVPVRRFRKIKAPIPSVVDEKGHTHVPLFAIKSQHAPYYCAFDCRTTGLGRRVSRTSIFCETCELAICARCFPIHMNSPLSRHSNVSNCRKYRLKLVEGEGNDPKSNTDNEFDIEAAVDDNNNVSSTDVSKSSSGSGNLAPSRSKELSVEERCCPRRYPRSYIVGPIAVAYTREFDMIDIIYQVYRDKLGNTHTPIYAIDSKKTLPCIGGCISSSNGRVTRTTIFCKECQWALCKDCFTGHMNLESFKHVEHSSAAYVKFKFTFPTDQHNNIHVIALPSVTSTLQNNNIRTISSSTNSSDIDLTSSKNDAVDNNNLSTSTAKQNRVTTIPTPQKNDSSVSNASENDDDIQHPKLWTRLTVRPPFLDRPDTFIRVKHVRKRRFLNSFLDGNGIKHRPVVIDEANNEDQRKRIIECFGVHHKRKNKNNAEVFVHKTDLLCLYCQIALCKNCFILHMRGELKCPPPTSDRYRRYILTLTDEASIPKNPLVARPHNTTRRLDKQKKITNIVNHVESDNDHTEHT